MKKIKRIIRKRVEIRSGTEEQRKLVILEEGEPVYIRDTFRTYVGDDKVKGGKPQTFFGRVQEGADIPDNVIAGDILVNSLSGETFGIAYDLTKVNIFPEYGELDGIREGINNLDKAFNEYITNITTLLHKVESGNCCTK